MYQGPVLVVDWPQKWLQFTNLVIVDPAFEIELENIQYVPFVHVVPSLAAPSVLATTSNSGVSFFLKLPI